VCSWVTFTFTFTLFTLLYFIQIYSLFFRLGHTHLAPYSQNTSTHNCQYFNYWIFVQETGRFQAHNANRRNNYRNKSPFITFGYSVHSLNSLQVKTLGKFSVFMSMYKRLCQCTVFTWLIRVLQNFGWLKCVKRCQVARPIPVAVWFAFSHTLKYTEIHSNNSTVSNFI
jgi:hypothetical protein